jgi:glyoxalase family protein
MNSPITGLHHVTSGVSGAQEDIDFLTGTVGLRLIKQTVLFDGSNPIYHLYYANRHAEIGSVMTTFPFRKVGYTGRRGSGQVKSTAFSVPRDSLAFWSERLQHLGVAHGRITERFGQLALRFSHPAGLEFELIEDGDDRREGWRTDAIGSRRRRRPHHRPAARAGCQARFLGILPGRGASRGPRGADRDGTDRAEGTSGRARLYRLLGDQ